MHMVIRFTEARPFRSRSSRLARRRHSVLSTINRHISDWIGLCVVASCSVAELQAMDERMLRDIGLTREQLEGLWRYGRLPHA
jgi:Domain of unknown function (DUF1127)